ncbi:arginase family protein [Micromonospora sp. C28SCA-DRY-2]|uniref:arginase family protein n=1 Tax=Micromonospora sp. C28SCA-DRY-2 TaxID=3059522 RepID=UPI0026765E57|nr:arginase family protein [Micromonospora sp. C28SCA-DRY-2]MDO3702631.1 arginase family protein [Micromonospora sp. C28SCA-DRY-2]
MTIIHVPYHQDQRLADDSLPVSGADTVTVEAALPDGTVWQRLNVLYDAVAAAVAEHTRGGAVPTVVSGDCLVALATIAGVQRAGAEPGVVWFDAHGDVHTLETSTSGYLGGLALRLAMGAHDELLAKPLGLRPIAEDRAILVDARDLDPAEVAYLAQSRLVRRTVDEVDDVVLPGGPIVLHVDVDVVDADELQDLRFPASGGPSTDAVLRAVQRVLATGRVVALNIACPWHPARAERDRAVRTALLTALTDA